MVPNSNKQTDRHSGSEPQQAARPDDRPNLSHRYGSIGIQAVAAAVRYCDVRSERPAAAQRIDLRFVESAG